MKITGYTIFICLLSILFFSCSQPEKKIQWSLFGSSLPSWSCIKAGKPDSSVSATPYLKGSHWQCVFSDTLDTIPSRVCFMAPDAVEFELMLNNKVLVHTHDQTGSWPSSFFPDSTHIYPNTQDLRPFVIDPKKFAEALKRGENVLFLKIRGNYEANERLSGCGLFIETGDKRRASHQPALGSEYYVQSNLPRINISVPDFIIQREKRNTAMLDIQCGDDSYCSCGEVSREIEIRIRGFSSSSYPKKQYSFRMAGDSLQKEKVDLLGMGAARKWILQGPYSDPSLIRNALVYELTRQMGYWSAQSRFVELVLNNNYQGVYLLMERTEINEERLALDTETAGSDAFLVQLNRPNKMDSVVYVNGLKFIVDDPPGMKLNDEYEDRVKYSLEAMMSSFGDPDLDDPTINWQSFADYMLVEEITKNVDAFHVSTFMHKDNSSKDPRIQAGPVWDFDLSMGSSTVINGNSIKGVILDVSRGIPDFWNQLFDDKDFQALMRLRYQELRKSVWSESNIDHNIDSLNGILSHGAVARNFSRFPVFGLAKFYTHPGMQKDHAGEIVAMKSWLHERLNWLDSYFTVEGKVE